MSTVPANPESPAAASKKPLAPGAPPEGQYTRRDFLVLLGWGWLSAALGGFSLSLVRYLFPNMLYEPNPTFKAGKPDEYPLDQGKDTVSLRWQTSQRVWVVTRQNGIYAFEAKCTHLGCTPRWVPDSVDDQGRMGRFQCPCHGSNFNIDGDVIAGPAPVPLYRMGISLAQDGQIVIDKAKRNNNPVTRGSAPFFLDKKYYS
jgi:cytochrome b6-f complex iron-sulfur subunit